MDDDILVFCVIFGVAAILMAVAVFFYVRHYGSLRAALTPKVEKKKSKFSWWNLVGHWPAWTAAAAAVKFVYSAWKHAPPGSPEQLGWGLVLAAIVAVPTFLLIKLADHRINRPHKTPPPKESLFPPS